MHIFSRNEIRNKNLFNVADCKIYWQKSGDYLCVKVDRFAKRKEKTEQKYTVFIKLIERSKIKYVCYTYTNSYVNVINRVCRIILKSFI